MNQRTVHSFRIAALTLLLAGVLALLGGRADAADYVVKIGDVGYYTLQDALDAVQYNDTIVFQKDVILSDPVFATVRENYTIDMNGNSLLLDLKGQAPSELFCTFKLTGSKGQINIIKNGRMDFFNGTVNSNLKQALPFLLVEKGGSLVLQNVVIGTPNSDTCYIQMGVSATEGSKILLQNVQIYAKYMAAHTTEADSELIIDSGIFQRESYDTNARIFYPTDGGKITIAPGSSASALLYKKNNYVDVYDLNLAYKDERNYTSVVVSPKGEALFIDQNGNEAVGSLKNILTGAASSPGCTIKLLKDITIDDETALALSGLKDVTLDFNYHTLRRLKSSSESALKISGNTNLRVTNGTVETGEVYSNGWAVDVGASTGGVTFENMNIVTPASYAIRVSGTTVHIRGGTYKGAVSALRAASNGAFLLYDGRFQGSSSAVPTDIATIDSGSFTTPRNWVGRNSFIVESKTKYEAWNADLDIYYREVWNAFADRQQANTTFVLLKDVYLRNPVGIPIPCTFDLGGHTLTSDGTFDSSETWKLLRGAIAIFDSAVIKNGTIRHAGTALRYSEMTAVYVSTIQSVTLENVTIEFDRPDSQAVGSAIADGKDYVLGTPAATLPHVTLINCNIISTSLIVFTQNDDNIFVELRGGSYTRKGANLSYSAADMQDFFSDSIPTYYAFSPGTVFNNGDFTKTADSVTYKLTDYGGGKTYRLGEAIENNSAYYATLEQAIAAVKSGETIHVIRPFDISYPLEIDTGKQITLTFDRTHYPGNPSADAGLRQEADYAVKIIRGDVHLKDSYLKNSSGNLVLASGANARLTFSGGETEYFYNRAQPSRNSPFVVAENGATAVLGAGTMIYCNLSGVSDASISTIRLRDFFAGLSMDGLGFNYLRIGDYIRFEIVEANFKYKNGFGSEVNNCFTTLADALMYYQDGWTLHLQRDLTITDTQEVQLAVYPMVIDLNGHTLTRTGNYVKGQSAATLMIGMPQQLAGLSKPITIRNGTINYEVTLPHDELPAVAAIAVMNSVVHLENIRVEKAPAAVIALNNTGNPDIKTLVTTKNCDFLGYTCFLFTNGKNDPANIFVELGEGSYRAKPWRSGMSGTADLPVFYNSANTSQEALKPVVSITKPYAASVLDPTAADVYDLQVAENYTARIGDTKFFMLSDAIEAVTEGQTITMLRSPFYNYTTGGTFTPTCDITIDMSGLSYQNFPDEIGDFLVFEDSDKTITIKNGTLRSTTGAAIVAEGTTTLKFENARAYSGGEVAVVSAQNVYMSTSFIVNYAGKRAVDVPNIVAPPGQALTRDGTSLETATLVKVWPDSGALNLTTGVTYPTLQDAIGTVNDGDTILLLGDIIPSGAFAQLTINNGRDFTIDFQGFKVRRTIYANIDTLMHISGGSKVRLRNADFEYSLSVAIGDGSQPTYVVGAISVEDAGTELTVESGSFYGNNYAIHADNGAKITIETGTFETTALKYIFYDSADVRDKVIMVGKPNRENWDAQTTSMFYKVVVRERMPLALLDFMPYADYAIGVTAGTITPTVIPRDSEGDVVTDRPVDITWSFAPATPPEGIAYDTASGVISVAGRAAPANIIVTATCGEITASQTVKLVTEASRVTSLVIDGDNVLTIPTAAVGVQVNEYTVTAYDQFGEKMNGAAIQVFLENPRPDLAKNVQFADLGGGKATLTATLETTDPPNETENYLKLHAVANGVTASYSVQVYKYPSQEKSIEISRGGVPVTAEYVNLQVPGDVNRTYTARVLDQYGEAMAGTIEWSMTGEIGSITGGAASFTTAGNGTITATLSGSYPTLSGSIPVTVVNVADTNPWSAIEAKSSVVYGSTAADAIDLKSETDFSVVDGTRILNIGENLVTVAYQDGSGTLYKTYEVTVTPKLITVKPLVVRVEFGMPKPQYRFEVTEGGLVQESDISTFAVTYDDSGVSYNAVAVYYDTLSMTCIDTAGRYDITCGTAHVEIQKAKLTLQTPLTPIVMNTFEYIGSAASARMNAAYPKLTFTYGDGKIAEISVLYWSAGDSTHPGVAGGTKTMTAVLNTAEMGNYAVTTVTNTVLVTPAVVSHKYITELSVGIADLSSAASVSALSSDLPNTAWDITLHVGGTGTTAIKGTWSKAIGDIQSEADEYFTSNPNAEPLTIPLTISFTPYPAQQNWFPTAFQYHLSLTVYDKKPVLVGAATPADVLFGEAPELPIATLTAIDSNGLPSDYTLQYRYVSADGKGYDSPQAPTAIGSYKLIVTLESDSHFGSVTTGTFRVTPVPIDPTKFKTASDSYVYTGSELRPPVLYGTSQVDTRQFTVSYSGNVNVGTATVTITPTAGGDYAGTSPFTINFDITKAPAPYIAPIYRAHLGTAAHSDSLDLAALLPSGATLKGTVEAGDDCLSSQAVSGALLFTYTTKENSTAATWERQLTLTFETAVYADITLTILIRVTAVTTPIVTPRPVNQAYHGQTLGQVRLAADANTSGTIAWTNPLDTVLTAGDHTLNWTFTPTDTESFTTASDTLQLSVLPAVPVGSVYSDGTGESVELSTLTLYHKGFAGPFDGAEVTGTLTWKDDSETVTEGSEHEWEFTPDDQTNYAVATGTLIPWQTPGTGLTGPTVILDTDEDDPVWSPPAVMPGSGLATWLSPFDDVAEADWFYPYVRAAHLSGLTDGVAPNLFAPAERMTRGMLITMLGRHVGVDPALYPTCAFPDVTDDAFYAPYAEWARTHGIALGDEQGRFNPERVLTRQELAVLLARFLAATNLNPPVRVEDYTPYADEHDIADWAREAVALVQRLGLMTGKPENRFDPQAETTRAEAVTVLARLLLATP